MRVKAFSVIEIIFVIAVISIILIVALPKVNAIFEKAHTTQIKSTVTLVREGIVKEKNKLLLANSLDSLSTLDEGDGYLFKKVLSSAVIETQTPKANSWVKVSNNSYKVYIDDTASVTFTYDPNSYTFDCDFDEPLCRELSE